jgi:hypothetical protein
MSTDGIRLYDPTAESRVIDARLAPRLAGLAGKRAGILDNGKANAGTLHSSWQPTFGNGTHWTRRVIAPRA